jgi:hypothetical protein
MPTSIGEAGPPKSYAPEAQRSSRRPATQADTLCCERPSTALRLGPRGAGRQRPCQPQHPTAPVGGHRVRVLWGVCPGVPQPGRDTVRGPMPAMSPRGPAAHRSGRHPRPLLPRQVGCLQTRCRGRLRQDEADGSGVRSRPTNLTAGGHLAGQGNWSCGTCLPAIPARRDRVKACHQPAGRDRVKACYRPAGRDRVKARHRSARTEFQKHR